MSTTGNPLSGHTAANYASSLGVDGLRDGDQILSASLTNMLEGIHGNGILLLDDTAKGGGNRNDADSLSGAVSQGSSAHQINIKGGFFSLDGGLFKFANGYNGASPNTMPVDITSTSDSKSGSTSILTAGKECLFTVFLTSDSNSDVHHVYWEQSDVITTASGAYPASPNGYLTSATSGSVKQTVVLATIRAEFNNSAAVANDLKLTITEINDKRVFVRPSPIFFSPVTQGAVANYDTANSVNSALDLDNLHGTGQIGGLNASKFGAMWMSHSTDKITSGGTRLGDVGDDVLFLSTNEGGSRKTMRFGPDKVFLDDSLASTVNHFTFDGPNLFILAPDNASTVLNPDNNSTDFPVGHTVIVMNNNAANGHTLKFDSSGLNDTISGQEAAIYVKTTSAWKKLLKSGSISSGAITSMNNADENELVTVGSTTTELDGEALLKFDGATLEVGASGNGADLLLHSATAAHVGVKWDHDAETDGVLTLGADDHGIDFKAFGETASKFIHWDASADSFYVQATLDVDGPVTVGLDDTGYDVKFFGATTGAYMLWDESQDDLILGGAARLGIGDTAPGTELQITADGPTITLKNSVAEHGEGGAESNILFEDHANASLVRLQGSHHGTNDDTKGKFILSTHNGSNLTTALTIDSAQKTTVAGELVVSGNLTVNGTTTTVNSTTMTTDDIVLTLGGDTAPGSNDSKDKGIEFRYYDTQARIGFMGYDESEGDFTLLKAASESSGVYSGTVATLNANLAGNQSGGSVSATGITGSGDLAIDTDTLFVDVSEDKVGINQATPLTSLQIGGAGTEHKSVTGGSSGSTTTVALCTPAQFRTVKLIVSTKATDNSAFEATETLIIHDSTDGSTGNVSHTTFATVNDGDACATYDATISGGNLNLTLAYVTVGGASKNFVTEVYWVGLKV